ncbi:MAG: FecR domain-containing protein [Acidobacteria bacterium]|nr:FecR domain-containing protein [Acidobacteriota bacterium]
MKWLMWSLLLNTVWVQDAPIDTYGTHIVRPGETLEAITEQYLGHAQLWRENWKLNPQVSNPHLLRVGQKLKVIIARIMPDPQAEIVEVKRKVERQRPPEPWEKATIGDALKQRDGLKTHERAYSELLFEDGTRLKINEQSLVYLQLSERNALGVRRESIEIKSGQADLASIQKTNRNSQIEIIMGEVESKPEVDGTGQLLSRARVGAGGQAEVMVFAGKSSVSSAGSQVEVPRGMGTVVEQGAPPAPPERLLPAPKLEVPAKNAQFTYSNPAFSWQAVPGAARYRVEVFRDPAAREPVQIAGEVPTSAWDSGSLVPGPLYWRVIAQSETGLDGYASRLQSFSVNDPRPDLAPPVVVAIREGLGRSESDQWFMAPNGTIRLAAHDDVSGVARIEYRWDEGKWLVYKKPLSLPAGTGPWDLQFRAIDQAKKVSEPVQLHIEAWTEAPPPPKLQR